MNEEEMRKIIKKELMEQIIGTPKMWLKTAIIVIVVFVLGIALYLLANPFVLKYLINLIN